MLWDSSHVDKGRHSKFQKLWLGPFKITFVLGTQSYILMLTIKFATKFGPQSVAKAYYYKR
jgi:hypothetical protein